MPPNHHLKLYYFPFRGRAEHIRQMLKLLNIPFDDIHISREQWSNYKEEMPFGQVPVFEVDGVKICQSLAIARFIGEEYGLVPADNLKRAKLNMIAEQINDTSTMDGVKQWIGILLGIFPCDDKAAYFREKVRPHLDNCASLIEKFLVENGSNSLLTAGDKITWADIYVAEFFSKAMEFGEKDFLEAYPHIKELVDRVQNEPAIKKVNANHGYRAPFCPINIYANLGKLNVNIYHEWVTHTFVNVGIAPKYAYRRESTRQLLKTKQI